MTFQSIYDTTLHHMEFKIQYLLVIKSFYRRVSHLKRSRNFLSAFRKRGRRKKVHKIEHWRKKSVIKSIQSIIHSPASTLIIHYLLNSFVYSVNYRVKQVLKKKLMAVSAIRKGVFAVFFLFAYSYTAECPRTVMTITLSIRDEEW